MHAAGSQPWSHLPDGRGGGDGAVHHLGVFHPEPAREHPTVAAAKGDRWRTDGVLPQQTHTPSGPT
eukprot:SAG25_NODE_3463_length_1073_cov_1.258727_1_plen_65_part_10